MINSMNSYSYLSNSMYNPYQVNTKVLGDSPAMAMGNLYQSTAQALSNAAHNATYGQQQATMTAQASTTQGVSSIYSIDTVTSGSRLNILA